MFIFLSDESSCRRQLNFERIYSSPKIISDVVEHDESQDSDNDENDECENG